MRRLLFTTVAGLALLGAGVAVAHESHGSAVKALSATFDATSGSNVRSQSCTGSDNIIYTTTRGRWTGMATGDPTLSGNATLDATILVSSSGDGTVSGRLRIDGADHTSASFEGVVSGGTHLAGLATGHGSAPWTRLVANISADWSSSGGFTQGKLGGGTAPGNAVVVTSGGCRPAPAPKPETIRLAGALTVGNGTVTVAGVTCNVPSNLLPAVQKLQNGQRVEARCTSASGTNTLTHVSGGHGRGHGH